MSDVTNGVPLLLAEYIVTALQRKLTVSGQPIDPNAVFVSATDVDTIVSEFGYRPLVVVIPGATQPDGEGHGAMNGGDILRRQHYRIRVYQRFKLDRHGIASQQIVQQTTGLLDFFEQIRKLFGLVFFGDASGNNCLLFEAMRWEGEGPIEPIDMETGIVARDFNYSCPYGEALPTAVTLTLADVT